jgi:hypothetical protein
MAGAVGFDQSSGLESALANTDMLLLHQSKQLRSAALVFAFVVGAKGALPEPPSQHVPWQPQLVAGIPDYVPEMVSALFDAGLADPRGGEYRRVELSLTSAPGGNRTLNGWYFPAGFAIGWDGLVHRVVRAGERANLSADVAAAKAKFWREGLWTNPPDAELVGVALLLRLDDRELARQLFAKIPASAPDGRIVSATEEPRHARLDWFQVAGTAWLSGIYHEAVEAHFVSNDRLTLEIGETLIGARAAFEAEWTALGTPGASNVRRPVAFLDPVPALIADSQRRLNEPARQPFDRNNLLSMTPSARIAALIDLLEDVSEQQMAQPGSVPIMRSPICKMLAEEGAAAIDPLIEALDHDQRLTRSFGFGRSFWPDRHIISVAEAAEAWLEDYYKLRPFRWTDPIERRAWLIRNKFWPQVELAFDLLDGARILLSANKSGPGLQGDVLRDRRNPSVSELLAKRATPPGWGNDLSLLLFQWDPSASLQALRYQASVGRSRSGPVVAALLHLGDSSAVADWATGLRGDRVANQVVNLEQLAPLWTAPEQETVLSVARELFLDPNAPMAPAAMLVAGRCPDSLIQSPLLISPAFRESIFRGLARSDVIGTAERLPGGDAKVTVPCGFSVGYSTCGRRNRRVQQPGTQQIRIADSIAYNLSLVCGFPEFDPEATMQQKDQSIAALADFLRIHAADLTAPAITSSMLWST